MNNKLIFLGLIPVLMLTVPNIYASEDNCDENPNDSLSNGDRGIEGLIFCDVLYDEPGGKGEGCYDRNDNPENYCENHREQDPDFCKIIED